MTLVVLTGGAGFLGHHVAHRLVGAGFSVRLLDIATQPRWTEDLAVGFVRCDVRDLGQVRLATRGADVVVHAAFAPPRTGVRTMHEVNVTGTHNVLAAALEEGVGHVVLVSSTIVDKSRRGHGLWRGSGLARLDAYAQTRALAEARASAFRQRGLPVAIVRPKTFVGPERVGAFAIVFELVRRGRSVPIPGSGRNRYQLLDIRDFAAGVERLATAGGDGLYFFGARRFGTVAEDLDQLIRHAATGATIRRTPSGLVRVGLRTVEVAGLPPLSEWYHCAASGRDSVVDFSRAVDELGWEPTRSNGEALIDAYDWFLGVRAGGGAPPTTHPVPLVHRMLSGAARAVLR